MIFFLGCLGFFFTTLAADGGEHPYVIGKLKGQLGNQLFQIATMVSFALDHHVDVYFPDFLQTSSDGIMKNYEHLFSHWKLQAFLPSGRGFSRGGHYMDVNIDYTPIPYRNHMTIEGWFQSEKYFAKNKKEIINLFSPPRYIMEYITSKYRDILDCPNTVSVHLRSYEYPVLEAPMHITYGKSYFERAILQFPEDAVFVVCSNHINWAKQELSGIQRNFVFIEGNSHYVDLYLMSMCKHNIICNSSFSWWSAYLNANPKKIVIAPPYWFDPKLCDINTQDLIPDEWVVL